MDNKLSNFGELFIKSARDNTLFILENIIAGHMKSDIHKEMHEQMKGLSNDDLHLLKTFSYQMVDHELHNMLCMFQENEERKISNHPLGVEDLNSLSDGLPGELYTTEGWIYNFSGYPPSEGL